MSEQFFDLNFEQLEDRTIRLEQKDYCGESVIVDLHPEQVRFIARRMAGMKPETADKVADLERRLEILTDRIEAFVVNAGIRDEIVECCGDGIEFMVRLDSIYDLAVEFSGGLATECTMAAGERAAEKCPQSVRKVTTLKVDNSAAAPASNSCAKEDSLNNLPLIFR